MKRLVVLGLLMGLFLMGCQLMWNFSVAKELNMLKSLLSRRQGSHLSHEEEDSHFRDVCAKRTSVERAACKVNVLPAVAEKIADCGQYSQGSFFGFRVCAHHPSADGHISGPMIRGTVPSFETVGFHAGLAFLRRQSTPGLLIDLGANVGLFTWMGLLGNQTVVAVDPVEAHVRMIQRGAVLNGIEKRVHLFQNAISDRCFQADLKFESGNPGGTSLGDSRGSVDVVTLNDVLQALPQSVSTLPVHFLKIDGMIVAFCSPCTLYLTYCNNCSVEGQEPWLLMGASAIWSAKRRPGMIFMELFHHRVTKEGCSLFHLLEGFLQMDYELSVFPRLDLAWSSQEIVRTSADLERFAKALRPRSEMDVLFTRK